MRPSYSGFEAKKNSGFAQLPPPGVYVAEIKGVKVEDSYDHTYEQIVCMVEITEGEYAGQYHKVFEEQKNSFGGDVKYKGTLKIRCPKEGDESWIRSRFEGNIWAVEQSNSGYHWDWDESKLKGKKVGINVRKAFYTLDDGKERETTEIARFESIPEIRDGKVKVMKDRQQKKHDSDAEPNFTNVSGEVEVPF